MNPAKTIKDFYNQQFFPEGKAKEAHIILTIEAQGEKITIPGIKVHPSTTIDSIFKAYHSYLSQNQAPTATKEEENQSKILNIEQVEYKNNTYLIEQHGEEDFIIRNQESGKVINPKSPVGKQVLKNFHIN
jgi:outer membrane lipopolysaccharide assembly protein LptE/RlpB